MGKNLQNHVDRAFSDFTTGDPLANEGKGLYVNEVRQIPITDTSAQVYEPPSTFRGSTFSSNPASFALRVRVLYIKWTGEKWTIISREEYDRLREKKDLFQEKFLDQTRYTPTIEEYYSSRYPFDVATHASSDFVMFDFFDYQPPFKNNAPGRKGLINTEGKLITKQTLFNADLDAYNRTGVANELYTPDRENYPQLILYIPDDISDTLSAGWEGKSFGSVATAALSSAARKGTLEKFKSSFTEGVGLIKRSPAEAAAGIVTNLTKSITGDNINASDVFGTISGVIRNPNAEMLFQKMNFRTFTLKWKMAPFNDLEAEEVMAIVKTFRKAMLPQYGLKGTKVTGYGTDKGNDDVTTNEALDAAFVKVPKVCSVSYMRGGQIHPHLPRYKMCAITDVVVNYTPDGNYAIFDDGMPVAVELTVSFLETKLIFSEDVGSVYGKKQITAESGIETGGFDENVGGGY